MDSLHQGTQMLSFWSQSAPGSRYLGQIVSALTTEIDPVLILLIWRARILTFINNQRWRLTWSAPYFITNLVTTWCQLIGNLIHAHDDVIKWKHFPRHWSFVRGIHRWPVNSLHKGQWRGALVFSWICAWINGWVNNRVADDLRRYRAHYDVTIMPI